MYNPWRMLVDWNRDAHQVAAEGGPSAARQVASLLKLRGDTRISRREYYRYRLWRDSLTVAQQLEFITLRERRATEYRLNPAPYRSICLSKSGLARRFGDAGLATPGLIATCGRIPTGEGDPDAHITSLARLRDLIAERAASGFVLKPDDGGQGEGVSVISRAEGDTLIGVDGSRVTVGEMWAMISRPPQRTWRMEERILPHPDLSGICPGLTPTVRVLALLVEGQVIIHAATLKIPMGHTGIDNFSKGNLAAPVDPATGTVGMAIDFGGVARHRIHPRSGARIEGLVVPTWEALVGAVTAGARALSPLSALGWDVVPSPSGPVALEANESWGQEIVQLPQDRGLVHGPFIELLRQVGATELLTRRGLT